ncbi:hypothetical protein R3P38DRAFT_2800790 [Favolaschia claudopus]|uniref:Uncharacterized protein n=1 Tax=Favolaschia claudopus TaxID=2862362 RepID=A0AAV9ZX00_9AGAR
MSMYVTVTLGVIEPTLTCSVPTASFSTQTVDPVAKSDVIGDDQTPRPRTGDLPPVAPVPAVPLPPPSFPNSSFVQGLESSSPSPHPGPQQFHPGPSVLRASDADPLPPPHSRPAQGGDLGTGRRPRAAKAQRDVHSEEGHEMTSDQA